MIGFARDTDSWYTYSMDIKEKWLPVLGFEELYEVSDQGRVRRVGGMRTRQDGTPFRVSSKVLKPSSSKRGGYLRVQLYRPGETYRTYPIHRGVLESFERPPKRGEQALHGNGDPQDNRLTNLRWGSASDNMYDKAKHGTDHNRNKNTCPRGHLLEEPNLQGQKMRLGYRSCRSCHQARSDLYNGSALDMQQAADTRYYMNLNGLRYPFGKRKEVEQEMWRVASE